jgi:hypothetical protein
VKRNFNQKNHQLTIRILYLGKEKKMKEHVQFKVKSGEEECLLGIRGVHPVL